MKKKKSVKRWKNRFQKFYHLHKDEINRKRRRLYQLKEKKERAYDVKITQLRESRSAPTIENAKNTTTLDGESSEHVLEGCQA